MLAPVAKHLRQGIPWHARDFSRPSSERTLGPGLHGAVGHDAVLVGPGLGLHHAYQGDERLGRGAGDVGAGGREQNGAGQSGCQNE